MGPFRGRDRGRPRAHVGASRAKELIFTAKDTNDFTTIPPAPLITAAVLEASYSDLASSSTVLSTDPSISIDCVRIYLTYPPDPTSSAFPTAPHKASCNTLELLTVSAGRLANLTLTVDVINILPEGKGVGSYVGSGVGTTEGTSVVGYTVGCAEGIADGIVLGSAVG